MTSPDTYREFAPNAALRPWIECFWVKNEVGASARTQQVLPDGCVDLLFDRREGRAWLIGTMSRPFEFVPTGAVDLVAVRFRPGGAHPLARERLDPWTDGRLELEALGAWARRLGDAINAPGAPAERVRRLSEALTPLLLRARPDAIDFVLRRLERDPGGFRVEEEARAAGVSRQWLTRSIRARAGLGPKQLARILRLRRSLAAWRPGRTLAEVALEGGYADQAHFTREARRITGRSPSRLLSPT